MGEMSTPGGRTGTVFPAARIVANPFATGIVVASSDGEALVDAAAIARTPGGVKWREPQALGLDELDENAMTTSIPAVTPGKGILKTPGGAKTPAAAGGRLRSVGGNGQNGGGSALGSPARTPGKTPSRPLALSKTPGAKTPGGSRFAQAPVRVEIRTKTPGGRHRQQLMIERERPRARTPGRGGGGGSGGGDDLAVSNPAAVLKTLPNATTAAYWLRRAAREEANGNAAEALSFIEQGIRRHAEPNEELVAARDALNARIAAAAEDAARSSPEVVAALPAACGASTARGNPFAPSPERSPTRVGSVVVVTPVRTPRRAREALECGDTVLTPVRRSARKSTSASLRLQAGDAAAMLESVGFAYVPNDALAPRNLARDHEDAMTSSDDALAREIAEADAEMAAEVAAPAPRGGSPASREVRVTASRSASLLASFSGGPVDAGGAEGPLTPMSEFAALEAEAAAAAAADDACHAYGAARPKPLGALGRSSGTPVNGSPRKPPKSPSARKASKLARAASIAAAMALAGDEPSSGSNGVGSNPAESSPADDAMVSPSVLMPNIPTPTLTVHDDPEAAEAFASLAAAAPGVRTEDEDASEGGGGDAVKIVVRVPSLSVPDAATSASPDPASPNPASPTTSIAERLANHTPGSVNTGRRRRPARRTPSPVAMAAEVTVDSPSAAAEPADSPSSAQPPIEGEPAAMPADLDAEVAAELAAVTPHETKMPSAALAPNEVFAEVAAEVAAVTPHAAKMLSAAGGANEASPLTVFARMMVGVVVGAREDIKTAALAAEPPAAAPLAPSSSASESSSPRTPDAASAPSKTPRSKSKSKTGSTRKPMGRVAAAAAAALEADGVFTPRRSERLSSTPRKKWNE